VWGCAEYSQTAQCSVAGDHSDLRAGADTGCPSDLQCGQDCPGSWHSQQLVAHTLHVIDAARALDQSMSETERGEFGYIVTGDRTYLDIYQAAARRTPQNLQRLRQLTQDNPDQTRRIAVLASAVDLKLTELQSAVEARQKKGFLAAYRLIEANLKPDTRRVITGLVELTSPQKTSCSPHARRNSRCLKTAPRMRAPSVSR